MADFHAEGSPSQKERLKAMKWREKREKSAQSDVGLIETVKRKMDNFQHVR